MNYEDLSKEVQGIVAYVAQNLDMADASSDLNEAMYYKCRLADVNPWLSGRIEELAEEYCKDNDLPVDLWEKTFENEEDVLGFAIEYHSLYGDKRYCITTWDVHGDEHSVTCDDADYIIVLIGEAEKNAEVLSYMVERDGVEIINTSNKVKHD